MTLKADPNSFGRLVLYGPGGKRLTIRYRFLDDAAGFRPAIEPHLSPLRDAVRRTIAKHGKLFRPYRLTGFVMLSTMLPIFLGGGFAALGLLRKSRLMATKRTGRAGISASWRSQRVR